MLAGNRAKDFFERFYKNLRTLEITFFYTKPYMRKINSQTSNKKISGV